MLNNIKFWLRVLITPKCWLRNSISSDTLSAYINAELDKGTRIEIIRGYRIKLGTMELWAKNYPYCFGYIVDCPIVALPNRRTVFRLYDTLEKQIIDDLCIF